MNKILSLLLIAFCWSLNSCTSSKQSYVTLKRFDKTEGLKITSFTYLKDGVKTGYVLEVSGENKTVLKNAATGKIVEEYINRLASKPVDPGKSCADQAAEQWADFNANIAPGLVNRANSICATVMYCVGITCNGNSKGFYLLLIPPTSKNCREYKNMAAEINRYAFE